MPFRCTSVGLNVIVSVSFGSSSGLDAVQDFSAMCRELDVERFIFIGLVWRQSLTCFVLELG